MSQSEWLGAILIAGFIVWLAMNQRLAVYWSILLGGGGTVAPASGVGSGPVAPAGSPPTVTDPTLGGAAANPNVTVPGSSGSGSTGGTSTPLRITVP